MQKFIIIVLVGCVLCIAGQINAQDVKEEGILAVVNGTTITVDGFEAEIKGYPPKYQDAINEDRGRFLEDVILREVLYQNATKQGLDKSKEIQDLMEKYNKQVLAKKLIENYIETIEVPEAELKKYYDENPEEFAIPEEVQASHILIKMQDPDNEESNKEALKKIEEINEKIKSGFAFDELAKENSECPSSAKGGDLGYFTKGRMVPEFEDAAFNLKPGEVSGIVKTKFGYHIIKVTEKKETGKKEFSEVKEGIREKLIVTQRKSAIGDYTNELKEKADIEINWDLI